MSEDKEFAARLARIQSKRPASQTPVDTPGQPMLRPAPRAALPLPIIGTTLGIALLVGVVAYAWDDIAILFPTNDNGAQVSYLNAAIKDRMTDEEIKRMNEDPRLEGMTELQKLILSH